MKHNIFGKLFIVLFVILFCHLFANAQPKDRQMPSKGGSMPPDGMMKELKKELNLTGEQEAKIQKIFDGQEDDMDKSFELEKQKHDAKREEMKKQREEMKKDRDAMREKMDKQRKETDAKIAAVLTDTQKKKFEDLQKKHSDMPPPDERRDGKRGRPMGEECPDHQE
jgi:Spy/CpxP family protein refolding chaperone